MRFLASKGLGEVFITHSVTNGRLSACGRLGKVKFSFAIPLLMDDCLPVVDGSVVQTD